MIDLSLAPLIIGVFLIAGMVKGVIGLGLPTVSLALLTAAIDLPQAMVLLLVPSFVTNLWQAMMGGNGKTILCRLWPFLLMATITVWIGAIALNRVDLPVLSSLLGLLLVLYGGINLFGFHITLSARQEAWAGPLLGSANGILTGMTGSFVVPGVLFLQAIGLPREMLIQAMGIFFTTSTLALALALHDNDFLSGELGLMSAFGLIPALIGMGLGQLIRRRLSEHYFRQVFFVSLVLMGIYIIMSS